MLFTWGGQGGLWDELPPCGCRPDHVPGRGTTALTPPHTCWMELDRVSDDVAPEAFPNSQFWGGGTDSVPPTQEMTCWAAGGSPGPARRPALWEVFTPREPQPKLRRLQSESAFGKHSEMWGNADSEDVRPEAALHTHSQVSSQVSLRSATCPLGSERERLEG